MPDTSITERLDYILGLYPEVAQFIMGYYQSATLGVELKADKTPVTLADQGAEKLLTERIRRRFPQDGVLGEEFGETVGTSGFRWILDPVDGTKSFVAGVPLFGTLIGLQQGTEFVAGVCGFPALHEVVYAHRGGGTWQQLAGQSPRRCHVRSTAELSDAIFSFTSPGGWDSNGHWEAFTRMTRQCRLSRGWGDCFGHVAVATGRIDVMIDPALNLWDAAALIPIVTEAGGEFIDWQGRVTAEGGNGISVIPTLRAAVMHTLHDDTMTISSKQGID